MGKISDENDTVLLISLPGKDVNSLSPEDFAVHSGFDYPKIEESLVGSFSYTFPSTVSVGEHILKTVDHNSGYIPMSMTFTEDPGLGYVTLPVPIYPTSLGTVYSYTDSSQFKIVVNVADMFDALWLPGVTYSFKYQIWIND